MPQIDHPVSLCFVLTTGPQKAYIPFAVPIEIMSLFLLWLWLQFYFLPLPWKKGKNNNKQQQSNNNERIAAVIKNKCKELGPMKGIIEFMLRGNMVQ